MSCLHIPHGSLRAFALVRRTTSAIFDKLVGSADAALGDEQLGLAK